MRRVLSALHVWPLSLEVTAQSTQLDISGDPADELITATSLVYSVPLMTRDKVIRQTKKVQIV